MNKLILSALFLVSAATAYGQPWPMYQAGTTYSSSQHSGSCGRMVSEDADGYVHVVWMNALTSNLSVRHVYYNAWDPGADVFALGSGVQVDAASRAGYATMTTRPDGFCFPAFHAVIPGDPSSHASAAIDFLPQGGAFSSNYPAWIYENNEALPIVFPKIAMGSDSSLHMVSMELFMGDPAWGRIYYSRGLPVFQDGYGDHIDWQVVEGGDREFMLLDTSTVIAHDVACSPVSPRIAVAYIRTVSAYGDSLTLTDQDVFLRVSEDWGVNWAPAINLTNFIQADEQCFNESGNWRCCNRDTLRPYFDLSVLIDDQDYVHVAFTSVFYRHWVDGEVADGETPQAARIWQWSEMSNDFSLVAERWQPDVTRSLPNTNAMVCRPSLSRDTTNGYLYCSYLQFDSAQYSIADRMNADAFVSVSTDNGAQWSVGVNVTNTAPDMVPADPGHSRSEVDATLPLLASDSLDLFYELDHDAGAGDTPTIKEMWLRRIPTTAIPTTPLMPEAQLHVELVPCGESAEDNSELLPRDVSFDAFPNPFNGTTAIRLDLPVASQVKIAAYDLLGRRVETILNGRREAGAHTITWNPDRLASGIYFLVLETPRAVVSRKVMLLK